MDEVHERLAERIREIADRREMVLSHLPDLAGVGQAHFWSVLAGEKSPTVRWLVKIATALRCDVGDFFERAPASQAR